MPSDRRRRHCERFGLPGKRTPAIGFLLELLHEGFGFQSLHFQVNGVANDKATYCGRDENQTDHHDSCRRPLPSRWCACVSTSGMNLSCLQELVEFVVTGWHIDELARRLTIRDTSGFILFRVT